MVFACVFVQGWIVDPYVYNFLYQPHEVLILPPHYTKVVQCSAMTCDVTVVIDWGGHLRCSLNLSPNVLADSPIYSSLHSTLSHLYLYMMPLFLEMWSLSLGATRRSLMVLPPLK